jgi:hypothetical protein
MRTASRKTGRSFSIGYVENSLEFGGFIATSFLADCGRVSGQRPSSSKAVHND